MDKRKFDSFADLKNSGIETPKKKETIDAPGKKYNVINVSTKEGGREIKTEEEIDEETVPSMSKNFKKKLEKKKSFPYSHVGTYTPGMPIEKIGARERASKKLVDAIMQELTKKKESTDATIDTQPMAKNTSTESTIPSGIDTKKEVFPRPALSSEKTPYAERGLKKTELNLQNSLYEKEFKFWYEQLKNIREGDQGEQDQDRLAEFNANPYGWIRAAKESAIKKLTGILSRETDGAEKSKIQKRIDLNEIALKKLTDAYDKNLPLKLNDDFKIGVDGITVDNSTIFYNSPVLEGLNKEFKKNEQMLYSVVGNIQRGDELFLVVRDSNGQENEVAMDTVARLVRKEFQNLEQRQGNIDTIGSGDILKTRVNGVSSTQRIVKIENGIVHFQDLNRAVNGKIALAEMKKLLKKKDIEFYIQKVQVTEKVDAQKEQTLQTYPKEEAVASPEDLSKKLEAYLAIEREEESMLQEIENRYTRLYNEKKAALEAEYHQLLALEQEQNAVVESIKKEVKEPKQKQETIAQTLEESKHEINPVVEPTEISTQETQNQVSAPIEEKESSTEKIRTPEEFETDFKLTLQKLLERELTNNEPKIGEFKLTQSKLGFDVESTIVLRQKNSVAVPLITAHLVIPLYNEKFKLNSGEAKIEAGFSTEAADALLKPALKDILLQLKSDFQDTYGTSIDSMRIKGGKIVLKIEK